MKMEDQKIEIRDIRDSDWYWISRNILDNFTPKIGVIGLALYNVYASYAREKGKAFPSQKTIAKKLGISLKTVRKYNKILEENNLIKIESGKKSGKPNIVILLKVRGGKQFPTGYESSSHPGGKELPSKENNTKENTIEVDDIKSSVKEIFRYFRNRVKAVKGFNPEIDYGKDGKLIKKRLQKYSINEVKNLIDWYLNSPYSDRLGCSLSICLSTNVVNLWKAGRSINLEKLYPSWQRQN